MPARLSQQQKLLIALHRSPLLAPASLPETLRSITSTAARILNVARVSVWLLEPNRSTLVCQCLFDQKANEYTEGLRLEAAQYPRYFRAIETEEIIQAHEARTDEHTSEFTASYLEPLGITSMLDASLHLHGKLAGVLCHEHVGERRHWQADEVAHALTLASLVAAAYQRDELHQANEALRLKEERFRTLVENAFDGILILDQKGHLLYASPLPDNPALGRMGYSIKDALGKPAFHLVHPSEREFVMKQARDLVMEPGSKRVLTARMLHADGRWLRLELRVQNALHLPGVGGIVINYRDITENWNAQQALAQSEQLLRQTMQLGHIGSFQWLLNGTTTWSSEMYSIHGVPRDFDLTRHSYLKLIPFTDRRTVEHSSIRAMSRRESMTVDYRIRRPDGEIRWLQVRGHCVTNEDHRVIGIQGVCQDVTAQKITTTTLSDMNQELEKRVELRTAELQMTNVLLQQKVLDHQRMESALLASEERYRTIVNHIEEGILITDLNHLILDVNPHLLRLTGFERQEMVGRNGLQLLAQTTDAAFFEQRNVERKQGKSERYTCQLYRKDGSLFWSEITGAPLRDKRGTIVGTISLIRDVQHRLEAEQELVDRETRYRRFIEQHTDGIWRYEVTPPIPVHLPIEEQVDLFLERAVLSECNSALVELYQCHEASDLLGKLFRDFLRPDDDDARQRVHRFISQDYRIIDSITVELTAGGEERVFVNTGIGMVEQGELRSVWGTQRDVSHLFRVLEGSILREETLQPA